MEFKWTISCALDCTTSKRPKYKLCLAACFQILGSSRYSQSATPSETWKGPWHRADTQTSPSDPILFQLGTAQSLGTNVRCPKLVLGLSQAGCLREPTPPLHPPPQQTAQPRKKDVCPDGNVGRPRVLSPSARSANVQLSRNASPPSGWCWSIFLTVPFAWASAVYMSLFFWLCEDLSLPVACPGCVSSHLLISS